MYNSLISRIIVLCLVAMAGTMAGRTQSMRGEADAFLDRMPQGLQLYQERAVRQAVAGMPELLDSVRMSRNTVSEPPQGVESEDIEGCYRLYRPVGQKETNLPVLVYMHGGGWCFGSVNSCSRFCAELALKAGICVLAVEYPLAPEHPFPAALNSCLDALRFVHNNAARYGLNLDAVSAGGDSSGGNLALTTALSCVYLRQQNPEEASHLPQLSSLVIFYPVTKAWNDGSDSWREYGLGYGLDSGIMEAFNEAYIGTLNPETPLISPACASKEDLAQLPRTLIINAERDILCNQGSEMAALIRDAGVEVRQKVLEGAVHLFITVAGQPAAFYRAVEHAAAFLGTQR